ncbi:hypothetical protein T03_9796 [Trichinella britovi]|uniref:Uncharacterized protein n=1 Tax=Trichinella britovi TaxID=45882 RepID=A0A0V1C368_TRIBR|nr:hypothetical protein T03_9796 [Trichinella britovi]
MKLNAASTIQKAKNRALAAVVITSYETNDDKLIRIILQPVDTIRTKRDSVKQFENDVQSNHVGRERKETIRQLKILYLPITFGVSEKRLRGKNFKRKSSEQQNCPKSTHTELLNVCHP